ncbi:hypothetical protein NBRC116583_06200 [Arenicella sp. 4NH20-0111]|uniref:sterol desaturase family protein n=1 Tax=Arenicella sp. 4NH20-0111 TaxID=3127648 RepID=UPI003102B704
MSSELASKFVSDLGTDIDDVFFLFGCAILVIEILKSLFTGTFKWRGVADMLANVSTQIPFLLVEVFVLSAAYYLYLAIQSTFIFWSFSLSWGSVIGAIIVADFLYYWEHRLAHVVRVLWISHAVHHSSRYMNITTGVRFGAFEGVWSMLALLPMVLIGFPPELIVFGSLVVLAYQTWIHTELIDRLGVLESWINTPSNHRVHHGSDSLYLDKNFGGILIIWDRIFGTYQAEIDTPRYGLDKTFDSVNPLRVWFSEFPQFFKDIARSDSAKEVFMRFFARPEWQPKTDLGQLGLTADDESKS